MDQCSHRCKRESSIDKVFQIQYIAGTNWGYQINKFLLAAVDLRHDKLDRTSLLTRSSHPQSRWVGTCPSLFYFISGREGSGNLRTLVRNHRGEGMEYGLNRARLAPNECKTSKRMDEKKSCLYVTLFCFPVSLTLMHWPEHPPDPQHPSSRNRDPRSG